MLEKPSLIVLNKIDLEDAELYLDGFRQLFPTSHLFPISAATGEGVAPLLIAMRELAQVKGKRYK